MKEQIIQATIEALKSINQTRFFQTERGYQGRFYCGLQAALDTRGVLNDGVILEMEYQKSNRHGTHQRPDIVLHRPAELHGSRRASSNVAQIDFDKLDDMFERLGYPLGFFINVDSTSHHLLSYNGRFKDRIYAFGVLLNSGDVTIIRASWVNDNVAENLV